MKLSKEPDLWFNDWKAKIHLYFIPLKGKEEKLVGVSSINLSENVRGPDAPDNSYAQTWEFKFDKCSDKLSKLIVDLKSKLWKKTSRNRYFGTTTEIFLTTDDNESIIGDDLNESFTSLSSSFCSTISDAETVKQFATQEKPDSSKSQRFSELIKP